MVQTENIVKIEGVLSEINLDYDSFTKNGSEMKSIKGMIKILVNQPINGKDTDLEIPVHMFASQYTNAGALNPAYESMEKIMKEYVSIAASDYDHADRVRITRGQIRMNEYYNQNGTLVSFPRIMASFVTKVKKEECKPVATFSAVFMVGQMGYELDKEGVETDKYKIMGILPQYGGAVDVVPFVATNKGVIDAVSNYWNKGDTVKVSGKLNFSSTTEVKTVEVDFGEPTEVVHSVSVSELVITGGSSTPIDGDAAIDPSEVETALAARKTRLAELKDKKSTKGTTGKAPAKTTGNQFKDLGF